MAIYKHNENPNVVVRVLRKAYNPIGFHKGYNAILWFICSGAFFGFLLARASRLDINGDSAGGMKTNAVPGDWYYYQQRYYNIGISLHLIGVIPGGLLALVQFLPVIRYKALIVHRINGYVTSLLLFIGVAGAYMIMRRAMGGDVATQVFLGLLGIYTVTGTTLAIVNIKRLQIDQHRAWMLRTWVLCGTVITQRLIQMAMVPILEMIGSYNYTVACGQIAYYSEALMSSYVACRADPSGYTTVNISSASVENIMGSLEMTFGASGLLGMAIHAAAVEIYLKLTPAEGERLRQVSYERQVERGLSHAGNSGLTVDRFGDSEEWQPKTAAKRLSDPSISETVVKISKPEATVTV